MPILRCMAGDITEVDCDAIVNAADSRLSGGAGVDGAIHSAAGSDFSAECRELVATQGECAMGDAVITSGGNLVARYVIHTVGPVWKDWQQWGGQLDDGLASCYRRSIDLAVEHDLHSIAFSNISTGVYRFPKDRAASIAIDATRAHLAQLPSWSIDEILFVCFDPENLVLYEQLLGAP